MMVRTLLPATPATSSTLAARAMALLLLPIWALLMLVLLLLPLRALLLLLTEVGVWPLALDGADLVGVVSVAPTSSLALLLVHDDGLPDTSIGNLLDCRLVRGRLEARDVDLNDGVHGRWELGHEHHALDVLGDVELVRVKAVEVRLELVECGDRRGVGRDSEADGGAEVLVDDGDAGLAVFFFELVPEFLGGVDIAEVLVDGAGEAKDDVAGGSVVVVVPVLDFGAVGIGGLGAAGRDRDPLSLGHEVGLHLGGPLKVVVADKDGDVLGKSVRHGDE